MLFLDHRKAYHQTSSFKKDATVMLIVLLLYFNGCQSVQVVVLSNLIDDRSTFNLSGPISPEDSQLRKDDAIFTMHKNGFVANSQTNGVVSNVQDNGGSISQKGSSETVSLRDTDGEMQRSEERTYEKDGARFSKKSVEKRLRSSRSIRSEQLRVRRERNRRTSSGNIGILGLDNVDFAVSTLDSALTGDGRRVGARRPSAKPLLATQTKVSDIQLLLKKLLEVGR